MPETVITSGIRALQATRVVVISAALAFVWSLALTASSASAATNLLQNPSLEALSNGVPDCWSYGGYGANTSAWTATADANSGTEAQNLQLSAVTSGDSKLISARDDGTCAPAATPGDTYTVGASYKVPSGQTGSPKFYAYYRTAAGRWTWWAASAHFAASTSWTHVTWTTPPFPSGADHISVGMGLNTDGSVTMDDFSLVQNDLTTPSPPDGLSAAPGDGQVRLSWSASTDPDSAVAGYQVFRDGSPVAKVTGTTYTDTGLSDGTSYSYSVEAYDPSENTSPASVAVSAMPAAQCPSPGPQVSWAPPGTPPLSDAQAAACVGHQPETRPGNVQYNDDVPTDAELQSFHSALNSRGTLADSAIPERKYVTGRPGLSNPSTDDLIQWVAHKWGIPEDWIRASMAVESWWRQTALGDLSTVSSSWYSAYPPQAQVAGTSQVYESMGISQIKWRPDGSIGAGTEPLRWQSTAFTLDDYAAAVRYYYNGDCSWCGPGYSAGDQWNSIGAWYEPNPWGNLGQESYIAKVKTELAGRVWAQPGF